MTLMHENERRIWYCLYDHVEPVLDDDGDDTGDKVVVYGPPQPLLCCVHAPSGESRPFAFGSMESYQYVITTLDMTCPISEHSALFVDREPKSGEDGNAADCSVLQVARYPHSIAYKVARVRQ